MSRSRNALVLGLLLAGCASSSHAAGASGGSSGGAGSVAGRRAGAPGSSAGAGASGSGGTAGSGAAGAAGAVHSAGADVGGGEASASGAGGSGAGSASWWRPEPGLTWQYQLSGSLDLTVDAVVMDLDLYETSSQTIAQLQSNGHMVVCYFDTAFEPNRPESGALEAYRGNPVEGWPGQYWLDIRESAVVDAMLARIELAASKGCDAVEADDVDSRSNDPGFPITANEQQAFITRLGEYSHRQNLAFGLKNDLDEIERLVAVADFAINEECFEYDECDRLRPFIAANKPVFNVEYAAGSLEAKGSSICPQAKQQRFDSIIKHLDLDAPRYACP